MEAHFYKKVKKNDGSIIFLYEVEGSNEELDIYKKRVANFFRTSDKNKPLYFTSWYEGEQGDLIWDSRSYKINTIDIAELSSDFFHAGYDFWRILDHSISNDIRFITDRRWSVNHGLKEGHNTKVYKLPIDLKNKLFELMKRHNIPIANHAYLSEKEAEESINQINEYEDEAKSQIMYDAMLDDLVKGEMESWGDDWEWNID